MSAPWPFSAKRIHYFEIHDHPACPKLLHDLTVEALAFFWVFTGAYKGVADILRIAMKKCETHQIIDICSGAGGPTPMVLRALNASAPASERYTAILSDLFPVLSSWEALARASGGTLTYASQSCSALALPESMQGFRTMFLSFHHFREQEAKGIIRDAVRKKQGIAIFELQARNWRSMFDMLILLPLGATLLSLIMTPFSLIRIFFHLFLPLVPLIMLHDGIVSSLRSYSKFECEALIRELQAEPNLRVDEYTWEFKTTMCGLFNTIPLYSFIGTPRLPATSRT